MKLDPHFLRAASRWAEAEYAYRAEQWSTAYPLYKQALTLYEERFDWTARSATHRTLQRLCTVAEHLEAWAEMAEYARAVLGYEQRVTFPNQGQIAKTLMLIARAERHCYQFEIARNLLALSILLTDTLIEQRFLEREAQSDDERAYIQTRLQSDIALIQAETLDEWALLEGTLGDFKALFELTALGYLTRDQMIDSI